MATQEPDGDKPPKVFISYRWSSPSHEEWVLRLAISLRAHGIDAKLDKWNLKEGQDTLAFMESMVNDLKVEKVLLICDSGYVERANSREGGVGTEAQIISDKVYKDTGQDKFAAVVVELDEAGRPLLPTYMSTRLYFDMSSVEAEADNFEKLVRWIFNQPFHAAPTIGPKPNFLGVTHKTGSALFRVVSRESFDGSRLPSSGSPENVLWAIAEDSQSFHLELVGDPDPATKVHETIVSLRPVSENAYRALREIVNRKSGESADFIHGFFESLMRSWDHAPLNTQYSRWDRDVYRYFVHDLFVSFIAICMEQRSFDLAADLLSMPFFKPKSHDKTGEAIDYTAIRSSAESLEQLGKLRRRLSLHADLLMEGHEHSVVTQSSFLEADLTLHIRGLLAPKLHWYPISALYLADTYGALPTYARAKSTRFYGRLQAILMNTEATALRTHLADLASKDRGLRFDYRTLDIERLIAASDLATSA